MTKTRTPMAAARSNREIAVERAATGAIASVDGDIAAECATYTGSMRDRAGLGRLSTPVWLLLIFVASRLLLVAVAAVVESTTPMQPGGSASTAPILRSLTAS